LLLFSGLAFFVMLPFLKRTLTITLDTDWLWRKLLPATAKWLERLARKLGAMVGQGVDGALDNVVKAVGRHLGGTSILASTWSTRAMALWVLVLLLGYLFFYYV